MLPKNKKKPDTCESSNIEGENFSLGSNPISANGQSISNVVCQTTQNESSDSCPDTENENEDTSQNEELIQTSNKNRFESARAMLLQIRQIQTKWDVSFPFACYSSSEDG